MPDTAQRRPDADVTPKISADGIRLSLNDIDRPYGERKGQQQQPGIGGGEAETFGRRAVRTQGPDSDTNYKRGNAELEVADNPPLPVRRSMVRQPERAIALYTDPMSRPIAYPSTNM